MHADDFRPEMDNRQLVNALKREPAVTSQVKELHRSMDALEKEICALINRLEPVLRQSDPAAAPAGIEKNAQEPECELSRELRVINERLNGIRRRAVSAIEHIEV